MSSTRQQKDDWKENLLRNYKNLVHNTDLYGIVDSFYEEGIYATFTQEEKEFLDSLEKLKIPQNRYFLKILLKKPKDMYNKFLNCLVDNNCWIRELLTDTNIISTSKDNSIDSIKLRRKVFRNYDEIVKPTSLEDITDDLISARIFDINDWEKITSSQGTEDRNRRLLDLLLKEVSDGFKLLMQALEEKGFSSLVDTIENTEVDEDSDDIDIELHLIRKGIREKRHNSVIKTLREIRRHRKDQSFVVTEAIDKGLQALEREGVLVYTGLPGDGKTKNATEIMSRLHRSHPDWAMLTLKMDDVRNLEDHIDTSTTSVILFEDCLGKTNTVKSILDDNGLYQYWHEIYGHVCEGKCKVILNVRKSILSKNRKQLENQNLFQNSHIIDLSSKDVVDAKAKRDILYHYFAENNISICRSKMEENYASAKEADQVKIWEITVSNIVNANPFLGFPLTSSMFCRDRKYTKLGLNFFKKPTETTIHMISSLIKSTEDTQNIQYCILSYMLLNGGLIDLKNLDKGLLSMIFELFELRHTKRRIEAGIEQLNETYIIQTQDSHIYKFMHQTILESVAICFYEDNSEMLINNCSREFIKEFIRPKTYKSSDGEIVLKLDRETYTFLADRFLDTLQVSGRIVGYRWWVGHPVLDDMLFVDCFIKHLIKLPDKIKIIQSTDRDSHGLIILARMYNKNHFANRLAAVCRVEKSEQFVTEPSKSNLCSSGYINDRQRQRPRSTVFITSAYLFTRQPSSSLRSDCEYLLHSNIMAKYQSRYQSTLELPRVHTDSQYESTIISPRSDKIRFRSYESPSQYTRRQKRSVSNPLLG